MLSWINKLFKNEDQSEDFATPKEEQATFILKYKGLIIGYLNHINGNWRFYYSDEFKQQDKIDKLVDFPEKGKVYTENYLWPFFAHRIPGLGQPHIQEIIKQEKLNPKDEIHMLRRFGRKSITNPFELKIS